MAERKEGLSANEAWKAIIEKYHVLEEVEKTAIFLLRPARLRSSGTAADGKMGQHGFPA